MKHRNDDDEPRTNSPEDIGYRRKGRGLEPPRDEGPRSFAGVLQQISDGELHDELSTKLQELVAYLRQHADRYQRPGKGALTLTLSVTVLGNGSLIVDGETKTKQPTAKRTGSTFWLTEGNNLSVDNPRQQKLPLRELPTNTTIKDISRELRHVREL